MPAFLLALLSVPYTLADITQPPWQRVGLFDPVTVIFIASGISGLFLLDALFMKKKATEGWKKLHFGAIAIPLVAATIYLAGSTLLMNVSSLTGGPVHWHADYEIWVCGERYELRDPTGIENNIGVPVLHEHNENRIHLEGPIFDMKDASVGEFFRVVGGSISSESLSLPTTKGQKAWKNGDVCNGSPARWHMFVNGVPNNEFGDHIMAPYTTIPPGDVIKLVFTEKQADQINARLFEVP